MSDTIHAKILTEAKLIGDPSKPDLVIIRMTTADRIAYDFVAPMAFMPVLIKQWVFDFQAMQAARDSGSPLPGKPVGSPDKKPS